MAFALLPRQVKLMPPASPAADRNPLDRSHRVLIVDDDEDMHRLLRSRLEARGHTVVSADSGEQALTRLAEINPDLIFLDLAMSGLTGLDVLDILRARGLDIAIVLTTAYGSEQVAVEALRRGADDYLRKPFDRSEFQAVLDRTLFRLQLSRQNALLQRQLDEQGQQLAAELARAAEVQSELLPRDTPALSGFELAARCVPAREVGGDFYDWQQLPGVLSLTVGDVMGKGMPAALLMATVRAVLRAAASEHQPAAAVQFAARALDEDLARSGAFVTLFHAELDLASARLRYVDAGHGHVVFLRADGTVEDLKPWGLPIGVLSDEEYAEGTVDFAPGDLLLIYSDGLTDARPELRDKQVLAGLLDPDSTAGDVAQMLASRAIAGGGRLPDDMTIVVLKRPSESRAA
jgi:serine phosphatase RsbU (regulator of sigma subunit)